jgi:hypothetical protein
MLNVFLHLISQPLKSHLLFSWGNIQWTVATDKSVVTLTLDTEIIRIQPDNPPIFSVYMESVILLKHSKTKATHLSQLFFRGPWLCTISPKQWQEGFRFHQGRLLFTIYYIIRRSICHTNESIFIKNSFKHKITMEKNNNSEHNIGPATFPSLGGAPFSLHTTLPGSETQH